MTSESSNLQKYETGNPLVRRLLRRFVARLGSTVEAMRPSSILDLGCGEGFVAQELARRLPGVAYVGFDVSAEAVLRARQLNPELEFHQADVLGPLPGPERADVVLCIEVLEHLASPERALELIVERAQQAAVVSVPWEPWFQLGNLLRGKYLQGLGNHPEHVQHFSPRSLHALLASQTQPVQVETCFPWLLGVARTSGRSRS
jgi:SAM-dependent methyltransferase